MGADARDPDRVGRGEAGLRKASETREESSRGGCILPSKVRTLEYLFAFLQSPWKNSNPSLWFVTMPSDLAKKKAAKKKEAAKARQRPRKGHEENGDAVTEPQVAEEKTEANGGETAGDGVGGEFLCWLLRLNACFGQSQNLNVRQWRLYLALQWWHVSVIPAL